MNNVVKGGKVVAKGVAKVVTTGIKVSRASYIVGQTVSLGKQINNKVIKDKSGSVKFGDNSKYYDKNEYHIIIF